MKSIIIYYLSVIGLLGFIGCNQDAVDPVIPKVSFLTAGVTIDESSAVDANGVIVVPVVATLSQPISKEITVPLLVTGSATRNLDYTISQDMLRFAAGSVSCTTSISIIDDIDLEVVENLVCMMEVPASLVSGALTSFSITIQSDDTPVITFFTTGSMVTEGSGGGGGTTINVISMISHSFATEVAIPLQISGSGVRNKDYMIGKDTLRFTGGSFLCTTSVKIIDDSQVEPEESVVLTMAVPGSFASGTSTVFTISIISDDKPRAGVVHYDRTVSRRSGSFLFSTYLDQAGLETISIPYKVTGSASAPAQHDLIDGIFIFNPGDTLLWKTVNIVNDSTLEGFKNLVVRLEIPLNVDTGDYVVDSITIAYDTIVAFQMLDNDISTWKQSPFDSDYRVTEAEGLYTVINGGATPYITFHYLIAQKQVMTNPANQEIALMTMRYPTDADMDSIFTSKKNSLDTAYIASVAGYPLDSVIGNYSNSGVTHYIRFDKMYFELALTLGGFSSTQIDSTAKSIVDWISAKVK